MAKEAPALSEAITNNEAQNLAENKTNIVSQVISKDITAIILSEEIQTFLDANGPADTMRWLLEDFVAKVSGFKSAELFSGYYSSRYSKRDILDKYDEIISLDNTLVEAIAKLGDYYDSKYIEDAYSRLSFYVISQKTLAEITGLIAENSISPKEIGNRLYSEYFSFVKNSLSLAQKVKTNMGNLAEPEEEPLDEIEATIRRLLEAEQKNR